MNLEELVNKFLDRLNKLEHVVLLLPNEPLLVKLETTNMDKVYLYLSKTRSTAIDDAGHENLSLFGNGIIEVINGTSKLNDQLLQENIEVVGSIRNTLLIESIFYLCREKDLRNIV